MSYKAYNDYELIYLVQDQMDLEALNILFEKYDKFIYKKIAQFYILDSDKDDFHQEGLMMLHKAVLSFKDTYNKTFMRYFEVLLERKFINLSQKRKRYHQEIDSMLQNAKIEAFIVSEDPLGVPEVFQFKSKLEDTIYDYYYIKNEKIDTIAKMLNLEAKQIYNAIYRIKKKMSETV